MPKATWGGGITADDIEKAESNGRQPYEGKLPKAGVYRFKLIQAKQEESKEGNPKLRSGWELDGSWKKEHEQYNGCPLWDHMPVMQSTAFRVKAFCLALGVTSKEFYGQTVVDDDGVVTKIGHRVIKDKDVYAYINVRVEGDEDGEREPQLRLRGTGFLPKKDDEDTDTAGADADDAEEKPKAGKKPKKGEEAKPAKADAKKKGKKKSDEDDDTEPPF